ncbi:MAG TPA: hypothetical protein VI072_21510 [Polyangiaceae bacterium]
MDLARQRLEQQRLSGALIAAELLRPLTLSEMMSLKAAAARYAQSLGLSFRLDVDRRA